jgi:hypothetical protein
MTDIGDLTLPVELSPAGDSGLALLCCARCGGRLRQLPEHGMICDACGSAVATPDGIVDFVAGASGTELDNIDYDAFYRISQDAALNLYRVIRAAAGPRWRSGAAPAASPWRC